MYVMVFFSALSSSVDAGLLPGGVGGISGLVVLMLQTFESE